VGTPLKRTVKRRQSNPCNGLHRIGFQKLRLPDFKTIACEVGQVVSTMEGEMWKEEVFI